MDDRGTFLPPALARLVLTRSSPADLASELAAQLGQGRRRVTVGLGPSVDVPLLPDELLAAEVALQDRDMVVAAIRVEGEGYTVERAATNFGVYVRREQVWRSVPQLGELRALAPGTEIGLGSTPAEAVKLQLPDGPWIARASYRSPRHAAVAPPPAKTAPTPPTSGPRLRWPSGLGTRPPDQRTPPTLGDRERQAPVTTLSRQYEQRFALALCHWRYPMLTFGGDPRAVLFLDDPSLAKLRAAIGRNLEQPDRGYELFVKEPDPDVWIQAPNEAPRPLSRGQAVRIRGPSHTLGFGRFAVTLPEATAVTPRFGPLHPPTREDVASVLELSVAELRDEERVKTRHRELARRFHPDRTGNDPGPTSRFVELQQAFEAWRNGAR